jgi:SAM-dependent methyltransferase
VPERFAYDAVPYDTEANPEAHPRSMATLARLFGKTAASPSSARVLEIGCGDGEHMIAAASYLPRARFVGFDLAADAIARGTAAARAAGIANVELSNRDVRDVRATGLGGSDGDGSFDYVVAHGVYSWVPESIRGDVLAVIRSALASNGVGFLSVNALPGWTLRRALRSLMREVSAEVEEPGAKVRAALGLVDELAAAGEDAPGFVGVLARAANEYRAHVVKATPPDAPFSRYVFHDLLAECNDPFSVEELGERLRAAGLRLLCETPLSRARAQDFPGLAEDMATTGSPFLQVLVCRDDGEANETRAPALGAIRTMQLWADLATAPGGGFRTTTGALLRAAAGSPLARAALAAPGFVPVASLADGEASLAQLERDLFVASCEGVLLLASEAAPIRGASDTPRVDAYVRARARDALERGARTAVLTSALHRSFRVPDTELRVVVELDGRTTVAEIAARIGEAGRFDAPDPGSGTASNDAPDPGLGTASNRLVAKVVDRFARYGFLIEEGGT